MQRNYTVLRNFPIYEYYVLCTAKYWKDFGCKHQKLLGTIRFLLHPWSKPRRSNFSCFPNPTISAASQSSEFLWLLSQLKTSTSQEETHRLSHSSLFQKDHGGLHILLESQGCGCKTNKFGEWRSQGTIAVGAWKKLSEIRNCLEKQNQTPKKLVSSSCSECCNHIPYQTSFISKGQQNVWTDESRLCYYPRTLQNQGHCPGQLYSLCLRPHKEAGKQPNANAVEAT